MEDSDSRQDQGKGQQDSAAKGQSFERRSAQALISTYMQMTGYGQLAKQLQAARERAIERRMRRARSTEEAILLQRQLEAQQTQSAAIHSALGQLESRVPNLASFVDAGLTFEDFKRMGLDRVVTEEQVKLALQKLRAERGAKQESAQPPGSAQPPEAAQAPSAAEVSSDEESSTADTD